MAEADKGGRDEVQGGEEDSPPDPQELEIITKEDTDLDDFELTTAH